MSYDTQVCEECGNHAVVDRFVGGDIVRECEFCGHLEGQTETVELLELQREAEARGSNPYSYPLAQFIDDMPGVKLLGDSGGDPKKGLMPFVAFELADHRTRQLENLGQGLRLLRGELKHRWVIEFTFEFQLGFELRVRGEEGNFSLLDVETAREDLLLIWRRLQGYRSLGWWKRD